jgi:hypothetical protein
VKNARIDSENACCYADCDDGWDCLVAVRSLAYASEGTATFYNPPYTREYIYMYIHYFVLVSFFFFFFFLPHFFFFFF